jgi:hypothetical protein
MPIKKRLTRKEKIERIKQHKKTIRSPGRRKKADYLDYYIAKVDYAIKHAKKFSRNGFYPMSFFNCVKERRNFRYCGSCRMYDICRAVGWIMYIFNPVYLTKFPDPEVPEAIRMLLRAYKRKLLFKKRHCSTSKKFKDDVWLTIQDGLPKEYDKEFYKLKEEQDVVEIDEAIEEDFVGFEDSLEDEEFDSVYEEDERLEEIKKNIQEAKRQRNMGI